MDYNVGLFFDLNKEERTLKGCRAAIFAELEHSLGVSISWQTI